MSDFLTDLLQGVADAFSPLVDATKSIEGIAALLSDLGWSVDLSGSVSQFSSSLADVVDGVKAVEETISSGSAAGFATDLKPILDAIAGLSAQLQHGPAPLNDPNFVTTFPKEVLDYLICRYIENSQPLVYGIARYLGLIDVIALPARGNRGKFVKRTINWSAIPQVLTSPDSVFSSTGPYGWGTASFNYSKLMSSVRDALQGLGLGASSMLAEADLIGPYYSSLDTSNTDIGAVDGILYAAINRTGPTSSLLLLRLAAVPIPPIGKTLPPPDGYAIELLATQNLNTIIPLTDELTLSLSEQFIGSSGIRAEFHPKAFQITDGAGIGGTFQGSATLNAAKPDKTPWYLIGDGTAAMRLELYKWHVGMTASGTLNSTTGFQFRAEVGLDQLRAVFDLSKADGFLQTIIGTKNTSVDLGFDVGWSSAHGFEFAGQGKLQATVPLHVSLAGVVDLSSASVSIADDGSGGANADLTVSGSLKLGPLDATVSNVGVRIRLTSVPTPAGAPPVLDIGFDFEPPSGLSLAIDAALVSGGGLLYNNPAKGLYGGAIQLELETVSLAAIGLLNTKLPDGSPIKNSDGSPGFSLLIIIAATFPPIQLGFGFALTGIGGLLGLNRTINVDALRAGVRNRAIDTALMPADPLDHASQLVTTLGNLFPVAMGRFVIGPMAEISWGTPPLLLLDIAILVEVPPPLKVAIVGRIRLALPRDDDSAVVLIHLDVLGVIDFDQGTVSIDATIYDSMIAKFALSGDMALRVGWKNNPQFALSVGGFHPSYEAPPGFPSLRRLSLSLCSGDNPRIRFETYLAVTSNSVQCGARVDLHAEAAGFAIDGMLAFDALIYLKPFGLEVDFAGAVSVTFNGSVICSVSVSVHLTGPGPWHISGKARVSILFISASVTFNATIGQGAPPPALPAVDVGSLLTEAIKESANWAAQPPAGDGVITLRSIPADGTIRAHPLGSLTFRQRTVPFGITLDKYGGAPVSGATKFDVTGVQLGSTSKATKRSPVRDQFAPGQFLNLTDAAALSRPSFESFESGFTASFDTSDVDEDADAEPLKYEVILVDDGVPTSGLPPVTVSPDIAVRMASTGPAAFAPNRHVAARRFAGPGLNIQVLDRKYAVADAIDPAGGAVRHTAASWTEAAQTLNKLSSTSRRQLQVIRI